MATTGYPPMPREVPRLSKSRFLSGLQCHKRLYLELHEPHLAAETDDGRQAIMDAGTAVGVLARQRFPGGRLIAEDHLHHREAEQTTATALQDASLHAIYEAAFTHDDVRIRADVLARTDGGAFDLIEVKSAAQVKPSHQLDLAIQLCVLEGLGVPVRSALLMHLNRDYVYPGGDYDLEQLFLCADLTQSAREIRTNVIASLGAMRESLRGETAPAVAAGPQCGDPYRCPFWEHCHDGGPEHPIAELPRVHTRLRERLAAMGIIGLRDVPVDLDGLSPLHLRVLEAVKTGVRYHDPAVRDALAKATFPVHFVDFETFNPALPLYPGTRPYQIIPFQWSDHILGADGQVRHCEYLHEGPGDPRRRFAETLLETASGEGSIVVYSGFESGRLAALAAELPDLAPGLEALRARLFDLLPVIRNHVYDPQFRGSFGIKAVLPALVPGLGYDDLVIRDGGLASMAYATIVAPETPVDRIAELRRALLAYCKLDTHAMLELFRFLR